MHDAADVIRILGGRAALAGSATRRASAQDPPD
jgi:hypothetical protein